MFEVSGVLDMTPDDDGPSCGIVSRGRVNGQRTDVDEVVFRWVEGVIVPTLYYRPREWTGKVTIRPLVRWGQLVSVTDVFVSPLDSCPDE